MLRKVFILIPLVTLFSCSSNNVQRVEHEIERDYKVRDASSNARPIWVNALPEWIEEKNIKDNNRYFSFESSPKMDRQVACSLARARVKLDIAQEIATFIDSSLGLSKSGDASISPNENERSDLREYVEETLVNKTQALIHGVQVVKQYWEKRAYQKELGAKRNYTAFVCSILVKMDKKRLKKAVDEASEHIVKKTADPELKEKVQKALNNASEDFVKAKQGLL